MKFVIDTNILINAFQKYDLDCNAVIMRFYEEASLFIVFDMEDNIQQEYRQNLHSNEMFQKWLVAMSEGNKVSYVSGKIDGRIRKELLKLGFHEASDQIFTAVALNSDKNIITQDSDYGKGKEDKANEPEKQAVLQYMTEILGLNVMDSKEARTFIKKILSGEG